jgi:hypothetical protein
MAIDDSCLDIPYASQSTMSGDSSLVVLPSLSSHPQKLTIAPTAKPVVIGMPK